MGIADKLRAHAAMLDNSDIVVCGCYRMDLEAIAEIERLTATVAQQHADLALLVGMLDEAHIPVPLPLIARIGHVRLVDAASVPYHATALTEAPTTDGVAVPSARGLTLDDAAGVQ